LTFGSFNRPSKLGDRVISLWSQVLQAVPGSRLLLGNVSGDSLRTSLTERFARCGVEADRLVFQPRMEMKTYLTLHHQVDFILDTFPYTGGTTTNHALWMGVPVLTMTGPSSMQCQCAGALRRAGLKDWVSSDAEDFVRRAVDWAGRLDELARLRAGMRDRLLSSSLRQPETVAKGLEAAFRMMWQRWCKGLPAESFEVTREEVGLDFPVDDIQQPGSIKPCAPQTVTQE
jgi:predicted O-linked N-acetylglucosamine transferase (SPINDLY family)